MSIPRYGHPRVSTSQYDAGKESSSTSSLTQGETSPMRQDPSQDQEKERVDESQEDAELCDIELLPASNGIQVFKRSSPRKTEGEDARADYVNGGAEDRCPGVREVASHVTREHRGVSLISLAD